MSVTTLPKIALNFAAVLIIYGFEAVPAPVIPFFSKYVSSGSSSPARLSSYIFDTSVG